MSDKVIVKFTKAWRSWFAGDVAGFDSATAEALVGGGVATSYSRDASAAPIGKGAQSASQPKGKEKPSGKRGGGSRPEQSLLSDTLTSASGSTGPAAEPGSDQDGSGGSDNDEGSDSDGATGENGGSDDDGTDPDDEKP